MIEKINLPPIFKKLKEINFQLFIMSFFFLRLPPFVIPFFNNGLFNSHSIARYLLLFILLMSLFFKKNIFLKKHKTILTILIFYLLSNTFSIIGAISVIPFLTSYKNIIFGIIFFYIGLYLIDDLKKIKVFAETLIVTYIINIFYQGFIVFLPKLYLIFAKYFIYSKYFNDFLIHQQRGRYFSEISDFGLAIIFLYLIFSKKTPWKRICYFFLFLLNLLFSFYSGYRAHFIQLFFSIFLFLLVFKKYRMKIITIIFLSFFFVIILSAGLKSSLKLTYSTIDRLVTPDKFDTNTIFTRIDFWSKAFQMGLSHPIFGIGLNNFYDYYFPKAIFTSSLLNPRNKLIESTASHPHNIFIASFAETGLFGFIATIFLIGYFFCYDVFLIRTNKKNSFILVMIISFWGLFLLTLITSVGVTSQHIILFWALRLLIITQRKSDFDLLKKY